MCEINKKIQKTQKGMETEILKMLSDQIVKLSVETKEAIRDVKNDLSKHIDNEISHLNGNVKNSQQFTNLKFEEIEKHIEKIHELENERNNILSKDIKQLSHTKECPKGLDEKFNELEKSLAPIIAVAKYKVLQFMLIVSTLALLLSVFNSFSKVSEENKNQIENITERIIK